MKVTMSKPRAIGKNVVIQRKTAEKTTPGGIVIPGQPATIPTRGIIISIGEEAYSEDFKIGDDVIFATYTAAEVKLDDGEEYVILDYSHLLCNLSEDDQGYSDVRELTEKETTER